MRSLIIVLFICLTSGVAFSQVTAPIPHPRISRDRDNSSSQIPPADDASADQSTSTPSNPQPELPDQPVSLSAKITEDGPIIPTGLIWRVFSSDTDDQGRPKLLFRSEKATASLSLPVGNYMVHVSYGRAQTSQILAVEAGPNIKSYILEAGGLRLRSTISAEVSIPPDQLKFDIFTDSIDGDNIPVALDVSPNTLVQLNAGTYSVVSKWGDQNAIVRADLKVEAGEVTEATLFHKAANVSFALVSKVGGEAIADVDWTLKDAAGETLFTHEGAFPSTVLAQGDYAIIAKVGTTVYNREFQVQPGRPLKVEVLTTVY